MEPVSSLDGSLVLAVQKHESFGHEVVSKNGEQKDVQLAAKNLPFIVQVQSSIDLRHVRLWAQLVYDSFSNSEFKPVDQVKADPMHYKVHVDPSGNTATIEARIQVLTSQHEDSLFRVKIIIAEPTANLCWSVVSDPVRVLSKPSQVEKYLSKSRNLGTSFVKRSSSKASPSSPPSVGVKRGQDDVLDVLARLEQEQRESKKLITELVRAQNISSPQTDFDSALRTFVDAFRKLSEDEKGNKAKMLIQDDGFSEILDHCNGCTKKRNTCETCPYKSELNTFDKFCEEFLFPDF